MGSLVPSSTEPFSDGAVFGIFTGWKSIYEKIRRSFNDLNVVIVGAGPIGLSSAILALQTGRVSKLVIFEERQRKELVNLSYQISFDENSVNFLQSSKIDFDNIEGCWHEGCFSTRVGVYLEYIFDRLQAYRNSTVLFNTKFDRDKCKEIDNLPGRLLVLTCDGRNGQAGRILGLNDFSQQHSCGAYGAIAAVDRTEQRDVPTPEKRMHNLTFDLSAYGTYCTDNDGFPGFSLKIFGNSKHRFISLAIARCDSPVVKTLRTILDRSMMRNIFLKCFNQYKVESEPAISDSYALHHMKFSPRLFEIKLSQRCETVAYFDDCDTFVLAEGEAAMSFNFHTGLDINPAIRGLMSLSTFIEMISIAETEHSITEALIYKMKHTDSVCKELIKHGMKEYMFS
ncbi:hypothetical protein FSP39_011386 [Pinctada imbricata]|uniref:Uncharacterized protein n=1 Tax=Pinctada imbricata TaxID=66713 RepID=A0AA89BP23_PINIB|nr:hypothetical protein FSP39_011386 [Pinctada imbricata]